MSVYINWNGNIINRNDFHINPENRGFRYGDGFFETMKVADLHIALEELHFERFFFSLNTLQFTIPDYFNTSYLRSQIQTLLIKNNHTSLCRVRLMVYRSTDGGPFDIGSNLPHFVIASWPLDRVVTEINHAGLNIGIYKDARKSCDLFSSVKSNNYLSYIMGAMYAKSKKYNDALVLNQYCRIADSTIANIFIVTNGTIKTPPLSEGCISGVYRKFLIEMFLRDKIAFLEEPVTEEDLINASEVFLTNAISGIKWVYSCDDKYFFKMDVSGSLYDEYGK